MIPIDTIKSVKTNKNQIIVDTIENLKFEIVVSHNKEWIEQEIKEGVEKGIEQGIQQGIEQKQIEMVERMIDENINISIISKISGLAIEEIEKIKQNMFSKKMALEV